jgi:large conductance mechanosensitive channel
LNSPILKEFRNFLLQGDIIALAVAFVMALAFKAVVDAFTFGIVNSFIAAIVGQSSFGEIDLEVGDATLEIGLLLDAIINFVLVGAAVFFFIVKPVNILRDRQKKGEEAIPDPEEIVLLREIRDSLRAR